MKLWHFQEPNLTGGCVVYRDRAPLDALRRRGHEVVTSVDLDQCKADDWDGFLFSRGMWGEYPLFCAEIKEAGKPILYDVDDPWDLVPSWYPEYLGCVEQLPAYYHFLHEATLVTTTTDRLAAHLRGLGARRVIVLPNCVSPYLPWQTPMHKKRPVVGFVGSVGHLVDVVALLDGITLAWNRGAQFDVVLMGLGLQAGDSLDMFFRRSVEHLDRRPRTWLSAMDPFANAVHRVMHHATGLAKWMPTVVTHDYWDVFASLDLDVACIPLADTVFNRCKSFSKFYEYATLGALTLASPVLHSGEPAEFVGLSNDAAAWADALAHWVSPLRADERQRLAKSQAAWVRGARDGQTWARIRERAYRLVVQDAPAQKLTLA